MNRHDPEGFRRWLKAQIEEMDRLGIKEPHVIGPIEGVIPVRAMSFHCNGEIARSPHERIDYTFSSQQKKITCNASGTTYGYLDVDNRETDETTR